ncbi:TasA family protein [Paenibacillus sp. BSR1-1]|uniref:TasA family protein n=1 Tax=Paenibacillus sp. BSR1-1 TaxID=3020845 RepID=UPI0025B090CE|nr:TasA family protein [Paenibacillus sp. BSR1-1]MDN3016814.1 TasA family protein [Paenibacillus sp. BSR1-1]
MSLKKKMGAALVTTALGAALIGGGTFAIFSDSATNAQNTFTSGTLDINLTDSAYSGAKHVSLTDIAPGDEGTKTITVKNDGSLQLRYNITQALNGFLASNDPDNDSVADPGESNPLAVTLKDSTGAEVTKLTDRVLNSGASETFTVEYKMPINAGNTYQAKSATYDFSVAAEQTRNN